MAYKIRKYGIRKAGMPDSKYCPKCEQTKSKDEFSKNKTSTDGLVAYCKPCSSIYNREYRQSKLEELRRKYRVTYYQRKYGLELEVAEALVENRKGICEICQEEDLLVVDHNHTTNQVRGFICSACNSALGYTREQSKILEAMIKYIRKYNV